ncbi:MAG: tetratricopeptide repeat protein [Bacteroidota bacterium]
MSGKKHKKQKTVKAKKNRIKKPIGKSFWQDTTQLFPLLFALIITLIVFIPSLSNDFVNWDDDVNILENENLSPLNFENVKKIFNPSTGHVIGNYNPLTILTFAIEKHFVGFDAGLYHINNLILHLLCVFFVYRIMLLLQLSPQAAMIVALLFGIHPMRVESVAWVTERKDVLFGVFYLAAIYQYLLDLKEKTNKRYGWILVLFFLSLLSKIQAVSLPLSLLAIDYYRNRPLKLQLILEKWPHFLLSLTFGLLGVYSLSQFGSLDDDITTFTFFDRLLIGAYSFVVYLIKLVLPYEMLPLYPYPKQLDWPFYVAPLGVLLAFAGTWWAFKKEYKHWVFGFAFFFFNVVFMLQILGAGQGFIADRFTYIPYLGFFFVAGFYYQKWMDESSKVKSYLPFIAGTYLLVFAYLSWQQCKIWKNGQSLWTHVIENSSKASSLAYGNRGFYYREAGQAQLAIQDYEKSIQANPNKANIYNSLGKTYFDMGQTQKALTNYAKAIERDNREAEFHVNQGAAYGSLGQFQPAIQAFDRAEQLDPEFDNLYLNRSLAYSSLGQFQAALKDVTTYLKLKPYDAKMWFESAITKRRLGQTAASIADFDRAISLDQQMAVFYLERGKAHMASGNKTQATQDIQRAQSMGAKVDQTLLQQIR